MKFNLFPLLGCFLLVITKSIHESDSEELTPKTLQLEENGGTNFLLEETEKDEPNHRVKRFLRFLCPGCGLFLQYSINDSSDYVTSTQYA